MHQYVTGHWAASTYSVGGKRDDYLLCLSPDGAFSWMTDTGQAKEIRVGTWRHDGGQDVLVLMSADDLGRPVVQSWSIRYVSGCEDANTILVLRWVGLAGRNLPILFQRVHLTNDPTWQAVQSGEKP